MVYSVFIKKLLLICWFKDCRHLQTQGWDLFKPYTWEALAFKWTSVLNVAISLSASVVRNTCCLCISDTVEQKGSAQL